MIILILPQLRPLRELWEETGYGYAESTKSNIDVFALRKVSHTIDYPRFFAVVRNVVHLGGQQDNLAEVISLNPTPLEEYVQELFNLANGQIYPEVNCAFAKAGQECGRKAVLAWLEGSLRQRKALAVTQSFMPWLIAQ